MLAELDDVFPSLPQTLCFAEMKGPVKDKLNDSGCLPDSVRTSFPDGRHCG